MINKLFNFTSKDFYILTYLIWIICYALINTNNFNYENSIIFGAADGENYLSISKSYPNFSSEIIPYHHAQRFLVPYFVGFLSDLLNINDYFLIFKLLTFFFILYFLYQLFQFYKLNQNKIDFKNFIILSSVIILNPYFVKYYFSLPTLLNDIIFINLLFLFCKNFEKGNNIKYFSAITSLLIKQTGLILVLILIAQTFFNKKKLFKNKFIKITLIIICTIFIISINNFYAKNVSDDNFDYGHIFGIFYWIKYEFNLLALIKFTLYPILSIGPAILIFSFIDKKKDLFKSNNLYLIILILLIILQPYLGGPILTNNNIVRLVSFIYPVLFFLLIYKKINLITENKLIFYLLIIFMHIWNLHPTYSRISFF